MMDTDYYFAKIRKQQSVLVNLMQKLEKENQFDEDLHELYEDATKKVEKDLKALQRVATENLLKEIGFRTETKNFE
ncbi:MAG: hypothetical protein H6757_02995 [Candidatus Omnitrophica bacterium]|nr:hypothetical protein [Candidatus Omnitrophota bacterium]